jgi:restriction modification system DNA specificity domain protein
VSRIDDLIRDLCPDGVEFRTLEEIFETRNGYTPSKNDVEAWTGNDVPWFRMDDIRSHGRILRDATQRISKSAVKGGRTFPADSILVATSATIGEHALVRVPHLSNQRFTNLTLKDNFKGSLDAKFLFYYCFKLDEWCLKNTTTSSFSSVDMKAFKKFKFPIPPLELQREVARALDQFTRLEAELEAELETRRHQYNYYLNELLAFKDDSKVPWTPLSELGSFHRGKRFVKTDYADQGIPCIHYGEIYTRYGVSASSVVSHLDESLHSRLRFAQPGDVIFVDVGEVVDDVGRSVAWLGDEPIAIHDHSYVFRSTLNPTFVSYVMRTDWFRRQKTKHVARTKVKTLLLDGFSKIRIPVPPRAEQDQIVDKLNQFDTLVNNLNSGLPAEIEARRQQYEHYRNQLLTFPERN